MGLGVQLDRICHRLAGWCYRRGRFLREDAALACAASWETQLPTPESCVRGRREPSPLLLSRSDRDTQLARLMKRNNLNREDAEARINAQLPLKDKARMANHVLDNSGEWSLTRRQVILLHAKLERSMEYLPLRLGFLTGLAGIASLLYLLTRYLLPSP